MILRMAAASLLIRFANRNSVIFSHSLSGSVTLFRVLGSFSILQLYQNGAIGASGCFGVALYPPLR